MNEVITIMAVITLYLLPALIAARRHHREATAICVLNMLLGWTLLGWAICFAWGLTSNVERAEAKAA